MIAERRLSPRRANKGRNGLKVPRLFLNKEESYSWIKLLTFLSACAALS